MNPKNLNALSYFVLVFLLVIAFAIINGRAGSLEPTAPPSPTMVTLSQLSAKIDALSSPVEKVVRGIISLPTSNTSEQAVEAEQTLPVVIDPNRCLALLSDAVASDHSGTATNWMARNGTCLVALTTAKITVRAEGLRTTTQTVSYQIIQYK